MHASFDSTSSSTQRGGIKTAKCCFVLTSNIMTRKERTADRLASIHNYIFRFCSLMTNNYLGLHSIQAVSNNG